MEAEESSCERLECSDDVDDVDEDEERPTLVFFELEFEPETAVDGGGRGPRGGDDCFCMVPQAVGARLAPNEVEAEDDDDDAEAEEDDEDGEERAGAVAI